MKKYTTYILLALVAIIIAGCKQSNEVEISDTQKLEILDHQLEKHPKDADLLAQRAEVLLNLGRVKESILDINAAATLEPKNVKYLMLQADANFAAGNIEASYNALTAAEALDKTNTDVQLKLGEVTFYAQDYDRSLICLSNVTEKDPDNRTALFMKAFIYKEKGDTNNAVILFQRVCDLYPNYSPAFEELGVIYASQNNPLALDYLNTAYNLDTTNTNILYALGKFYQNNDDMTTAEELYKRLLSINPNSSDTWNNLGYIELFYYRDYERAVEYLTKAIEVDNSNIYALVNRGCAYELQNNRKAARQDFETALSIDSQFTPAIEGAKRTI